MDRFGVWRGLVVVDGGGGVTVASIWGLVGVDGGIGEPIIPTAGSGGGMGAATGSADGSTTGTGAKTGC